MEVRNPNVRKAILTRLAPILQNTNVVEDEVKKVTPLHCFRFTDVPFSVLYLSQNRGRNQAVMYTPSTDSMVYHFLRFGDEVFKAGRVFYGQFLNETFHVYDLVMEFGHLLDKLPLFKRLNKTNLTIDNDSVYDPILSTCRVVVAEATFDGFEETYKEQMQIKFKSIALRFHVTNVDSTALPALV